MMSGKDQLSEGTGVVSFQLSNGPTVLTMFGREISAPVGPLKLAC